MPKFTIHYRSEEGKAIGLPPFIRENESRKLESLNLDPIYAHYQFAERDDLTVVTISGPSCVGKGPLLAALKEFFPIKYGEVPVIKSMRPGGLRPDDNPAHFMKPEDILKLPESEYLIGNCRGSPQAISILDIMNSEEDLVVIEAHHSLVSALEDRESLLRCRKKIKVFVSPLSREEIEAMKNEDYQFRAKYLFLTQSKKYALEKIDDLMSAKLDFRTRYQGKNPEDKIILEDNRLRARDACHEMGLAFLTAPFCYNQCSSGYVRYDHILVNHDGEGHPNWHRTTEGKFTAYPEGDAWKAVEALAKILEDATGTPRRPIQGRLFQ